MIDSAFWIVIAGLACTILYASFRLMFACKVEELHVCYNCFSCKRDTDHEKKDIQFNTQQPSTRQLASVSSSSTEEAKVI